jgi:hypothetical protein
VIVNLNDVFALQPRCRKRFVEKAIAHLRVMREFCLDELHGDACAEARVHAFPHRAHAAPTQQADEPVLARDDRVLPRRLTRLAHAHTLNDGPRLGNK